ncbi:ABC transporter permease [Persicimonas caeni]|uniref:ABC transporter permease n=1 Tax=Persicimonas caeni TaxID=2292766 RepID=A0A4Y6Q1L0_PERCE|nr:ABC transporter permease [Persicimonas caeni]QDG54443.1 ABC transporter permease [Persicimonas caeni]QED35664.1 ABC transporter permease [Persicimonas caeni]
MTTYIVKRILLMIPTLFIIVLVVFGVLQLAPGKPSQGQAGSTGAESAQGAEARESYRIFKEQFNFDKPVFFNFRYNIDTDEVKQRLEILADQQLPVCPDEGAKPENCISASEKPESGKVIDARDTIEDWGEYIVPHLYAIAQKSDRLDVRLLAIDQLAINAQLDLKNEFSDKQSDEDRAFNKKAYAENQKIQGWTLPADVSATQVNELLDEKWGPWLEEHAERFDYDLGEKFWITVSDTRFAKYWGNLLNFDFGISHVDKQPILPKVIEKMKVSIVLGFFSIFFAYLISVPLGVWSAYKQHTTADQVVTVVLFMLYSLPSFFTAVLLLQWFTTGNPFEWFPTGGFEGNNVDSMTTWEHVTSVAYHMVLPVFCLTYGALASLSRYARSGLLDVIRADYIRTARAKGLSEPMVIIKHAVRNGMIPILTLLGTLLPALIGGSVVLEFVFNIPGMGLYMLNSIFLKDYNAIMALTLFSAVLTLIGILLSDISYAVVDPRISFD